MNPVEAGGELYAVVAGFGLASAAVVALISTAVFLRRCAYYMKDIGLAIRFHALQVSADRDMQYRSAFKITKEKG
jgi:hypothetical protein